MPYEGDATPNSGRRFNRNRETRHGVYLSHNFVSTSHWRPGLALGRQHNAVIRVRLVVGKRMRRVRVRIADRDLSGDLIIHVNRALERRTCVKKIILSFSRFVPSSLQMSLFSDNSKLEKITGAFDMIQKKFGKKYIRYGG